MGRRLYRQKRIFYAIVAILLVTLIALNTWYTLNLTEINGATTNVETSVTEADEIETKMFYQCKERRRVRERRVVAFHHVFKAGGTTIRRLMEKIAMRKKCGVGLATIGTNSVSRKHIRGGAGVETSFHVTRTIGRWSRHDLSLKRFFRRTKWFTGFKNSAARKLAREVDIVSGHIFWDFPDNLFEGNVRPENILRIAFVREPVARFVSGVIYHHKGHISNIQSAVQFVDREVRKVLRKKEPYVIGYWKYFSTSAEFASSGAFDAETKTSMITDRLHDLAVVGVVERMATSINLILSMVAPDLSDDERVEHFDVQTANKGKVSTSEVIRWLDSNRSALMERVRGMMRYEYQIYEAGLRLHMKQCAAANFPLD